MADLALPQEVDIPTEWERTPFGLPRVENAVLLAAFDELYDEPECSLTPEMVRRMLMALAAEVTRLADVVRTDVLHHD